MPDKDGITIVKASIRPESRQKSKEDQTSLDYIKPKIEFSTLTTTAENSFIIG